MMIGACGIACELCALRTKGKCEMGGCIAGTDEKAPDKLENLKAAGTRTCGVLECAIQKKVGYCLRCKEFPCEIHYRQSPYCVELLDFVKEYWTKHKGRFKQEECERRAGGS